MIITRLFLKASAFMFLCGLLSACASTHPPKESSAQIVEVVTLKLRSGVTDPQFLVANKRVELEHVNRQPGFISRETARGENGEWLVIVHWANVRDAEASMESFASAPAAQGFMAVIDGVSMKMVRYTIQH